MSWYYSSIEKAEPREEGMDRWIVYIEELYNRTTAHARIEREIEVLRK